MEEDKGIRKRGNDSKRYESLMTYIDFRSDVLWYCAVNNVYRLGVCAITFGRCYRFTYSSDDQTSMGLHWGIQTRSINPSSWIPSSRQSSRWYIISSFITNTKEHFSVQKLEKSRLAVSQTRILINQ